MLFSSWKDDNVFLVKEALTKFFALIDDRILVIVDRVDPVVSAWSWWQPESHHKAPKTPHLKVALAFNNIAIHVSWLTFKLTLSTLPWIIIFECYGNLLKSIYPLFIVGVHMGYAIWSLNIVIAVVRVYCVPSACHLTRIKVLDYGWISWTWTPVDLRSS